MNSSFNDQDDPPGAKAAQEAAAWLTRLNSRVIDTAELESFFAWRRVPRNAKAYDELELHWRTSLELADDADVAQALGEAMDIHRGSRRWPAGRVALVAGLLTFLVCAAFLLLARDTVFETAVGEQRLVQLEDGSRIRLDTDTRVSVGIGAKRMIQVHRGRALFDVAHDPTRPFEVTAGAMQVRALGTKFEVDAAVNREQVALLEGRVEVSANGVGTSFSPLTLAPGQAVRVSRTGLGKIFIADSDAIEAWTQGRLDFHETPLVTAVEEVNRYAQAPIRLTTARWADQKVNGGFAVGDVRAFVEAVTTLYPLKAVSMADGSIELRDR